MEERLGPWLVWLRAAMVGSMVVLFGVVGHVSADGLLPGTIAMTLLLAVSVTLAGLLLVRPASTTRLVAMLVAGQFLVHVVLSSTAGHRGEARLIGAASHLPAAPATLPSVNGHRVGSLFEAHQLAQTTHTSSPPSLPIGPLIDDLAAHAPLMTAHLAAAALVGLWLALGERTLWALIALTGRQLLAVTAMPALVPLPGTPRMTRHTAGAASALHSLWHPSPTTERGPPPAFA